MNQKLSNRPQNKNFGSRAGKQTSARRHLEHKQIYYNNPLKCLKCNTIIPYEKRSSGKQPTKFCNHSCSATYSNTLRNISRPPKPPKGRNYCQVTFKICPTCNNYFRSKGSRHEYCIPTCNPTFYTRKCYRSLCKFKINKSDHPELFNPALIQRYGWYTPTNNKANNPANLNGVCWDHLFRIEDGYINQILPSIINHPANAELVPWRVNISRKKSLITFDELLTRIHLWESGDRDLRYFYTDPIN